MNLIKKTENGILVSADLWDDTSISPNAKYLIVFLFAKPDNWEFNLLEIADSSRGLHVNDVKRQLKAIQNSKYASVLTERFGEEIFKL